MKSLFLSLCDSPSACAISLHTDPSSWAVPEAADALQGPSAGASQAEEMGFFFFKGNNSEMRAFKKSPNDDYKDSCFVFKLQAQTSANIQLSLLGIVASQMCYIALNLYLTCLVTHRRYRFSKRMGVILLFYLITPFHFQNSYSLPIFHKIFIQKHENYSSLDF